MGDKHEKVLQQRSINMNIPVELWIDISAFCMWVHRIGTNFCLNNNGQDDLRIQAQSSKSQMM